MPRALRAAGANAAFNMYAEAGVGLAASVAEDIGALMGEAAKDSKS